LGNNKKQRPAVVQHGKSKLVSRVDVDRQASEDGFRHYFLGQLGYAYHDIVTGFFSMR